MSMLAYVDWNEILRPPGLPILLLIVMVGTVIMTAIIAPQARRVSEIRLKEKMVNRGFRAEEIRMVLDAGARPRESRRSKRRAERQAKRAARHAEKLARVRACRDFIQTGHC
jgi:hypothetical protein